MPNDEKHKSPLANIGPASSTRAAARDNKIEAARQHQSSPNEPRCRSRSAVELARAVRDGSLRRAIVRGGVAARRCRWQSVNLSVGQSSSRLVCTFSRSPSSCNLRGRQAVSQSVSRLCRRDAITAVDSTRPDDDVADDRLSYTAQDAAR